MNQDGISFCTSIQWEEMIRMQTSTAIHMNQRRIRCWNDLQIQDISGRETHCWIMDAEKDG